jgi:hypothetical protein
MDTSLFNMTTLIAAYEKSVADQIEAQINPPTVALPLPWSV